MKFEQFLEASINDKFSYIVEEDEKQEKDEKDSKEVKDAICMNSSLFMRVLELVREDVDDDEVLHHIVEKIMELCKESDEPLTMKAYDEIEKVVDEESEDDDEDDEDSTEDQEDEDLDESKKCDCEDDEKLEEEQSDEDLDECDESCDEDKKDE